MFKHSSNYGEKHEKQEKLVSQTCSRQTFYVLEKEQNVHKLISIIDSKQDIPSGKNMHIHLNS